MMTVHTENHLELLEYGEAAFSQVGRGDPQVAFLVRERTAVIKYLGETGVGVRGGFFPVGRIIATAVVFQVGRYVSREYATWWDYHRQGNSGIFHLMAGQEYLSFHFYGDNLRLDRSLVAPNPLRDFFTETIAEIRTLPPWNQADFHEVLMKVNARVPTPRDLWNTLG